MHNSYECTIVCNFISHCGSKMWMKYNSEMAIVIYSKTVLTKRCIVCNKNVPPIPHNTISFIKVTSNFLVFLKYIWSSVCTDFNHSASGTNYKIIVLHLLFSNVLKDTLDTIARNFHVSEKGRRYKPSV